MQHRRPLLVRKRQPGEVGDAGSDAHAVSDVGKCATEFDVRIETLDDLIEQTTLPQRCPK